MVLDIFALIVIGVLIAAAIWLVVLPGCRVKQRSAPTDGGKHMLIPMTNGLVGNLEPKPKDV